MVSRREFLKVSAVGAGAAVAGLAGGYLLGTSSSSNPTSTAVTTRNISILGRDADHGDINTALVDLFQREYTNIKVEYTPLAYAALFDKIVLTLKESSSAYDVLYLDDPWIPQLGELGWLTDIEALARESGVSIDLSDYPEPVREVARHPYKTGKLVGMPQMGNAQMFGYRRDVFEKLGLSQPETWTDVLNACEKIKGSGLVEYPVIFRGARANPVVASFIPILHGFGARITTPDAKKAALGSKAVEALEFFVKLKSFAPPGVENFGSPDLVDRLLGGKVAMSVEVWPSWVKDADNVAVSKVPGLLAYTTTPGERENPAPLLGVWYWGIPAASKNKEAALIFSMYASSPYGQRMASIMKGLPPVSLKAAADKDVRGLRRWVAVQIESLKIAVPRPRTPHWPKIEDTLSSYLNQALTGALKPADAITMAADSIDKILA